MPMPCENQWRQRAAAAPFSSSVFFTPDALVLGQGTILRRLGEDDPKAVSLRVEAAHDRMVALLTVAAHGRLAKSALLQLDAALRDWRRGDRGLAAIRLAFAPLPRLSDPDDGYRLFLAETALDAGLTPNELLRELGYFACATLLKFNPAQPRVPSGSGARSGQWTSESASADATQPRRAPTRPSSSPGAADTPTLIPVFLDTQPDGEDEVIRDKERRLGFGETPRERIEDGHVLRPPTPGGQIGPALPGDPWGAGIDAPDIGAKPVPLPKPAPGGNPSVETSDANSDGKQDKGLACPKPQDDRPNGPNPSGDEFEYQMSLLINPNNPTPKYSAATPNVTSQAYYLPSPSPDGKTSFDDCKKDGTPTVLNIPNLKPGDMFEMKASGWSGLLSNENTRGYQSLKTQIESQNRAVLAEGGGRQIYYCMADQSAVNLATNAFGMYSNSHFLVCH